MSGHTRPKVVVSDAISSWLIYQCKKSKMLKHSLHGYDDQRILSDWTRGFWSITCEVEFSQIYGLQREKREKRIVRSFILGLAYFTQKVVTIFFKKLKFSFSVLFLGKQEFFWKIRLRHFVLFLEFYHSVKLQKKMI